MTNALTIKPLTPDAWGMLTSIAKMAYESRKFGVTEGEAAIKLLFCFENNLPLTTANKGVYVVNGQIAVMSNVIAGKFKTHAQYDFKIEKLDNDGCTIAILFEGEKIGETTFDKEDAKRADLLNKDNWKAYPRNCYFGRAITNAYRFYAPDLFLQPIYTPEELGQPTNAEGEVIEGNWQVYTEQPKALSPLEILTNTYGVEAILNANNGQVPTTDEECLEVAEKLEGQNV